MPSKRVVRLTDHAQHDPIGLHYSIDEAFNSEN